MDDSVSENNDRDKVNTDTINTDEWDDGMESSLAYEISVSSQQPLPLLLVDRRSEIDGTQRGSLKTRNRIDGSISADPPADLHLHGGRDLRQGGAQGQDRLSLDLLDHAFEFGVSHGGLGGEQGETRRWMQMSAPPGWSGAGFRLRSLRFQGEEVQGRQEWGCSGYV